MKYRQVLNHHPAMCIRFSLYAPMVFVQLLPLVFFDFMLEMYHQIGFRLMGILRLKQRNFIRMDRPNCRT